MKNIFTLAFLISSFFVFSQAEFIVNTELLNVRSGPSTDYDVVGQIKADQTVTEVSKSGNWSEIQTDHLRGYVSSKYLTKLDSEEKTDNDDDSSIVGGLIILGIIGYVLYRVKNFFSNLFGGTSSIPKKRNTPARKSSYNHSRNSAVYRFRVKGNGSAGAVQYVDGMNVEVAVKGLGASGSPFNTTVEKLFVQEFARKYDIEPKFHHGIKMLFKRDRLDVELM